MQLGGPTKWTHFAAAPQAPPQGAHGADNDGVPFPELDQGQPGAGTRYGRILHGISNGVSQELTPFHATSLARFEPGRVREGA